MRRARWWRRLAIYPPEPRGRWNDALAILAKLARDHSVELIATGNGTAGRETDKLATELVRRLPAFKAAVFGMILEGVVTNVAAFGAFVDVGVHQDGWCTSRRWRRLS